MTYTSTERRSGSTTRTFNDVHSWPISVVMKISDEHEYKDPNLKLNSEDHHYIIFAVRIEAKVYQ